MGKDLEIGATTGRVQRVVGTIKPDPAGMRMSRAIKVLATPQRGVLIEQGSDLVWVGVEDVPQLLCLLVDAKTEAERE